jgi:CRISPR-associated protein Cas1
VRELLNTLYVQTQGTVLHLDHDTVKIMVERETKLRLPLLRLSGIVVFGRVTVTPFLIQRCAEDGRSLVWLDRNGRFKARVEGPARGNVLLRRAQHLALSDKQKAQRIAQQIVAAKLQNSRQVLLRGAREAGTDDARAALSDAAARIAEILGRLGECRSLDELRGAEGDAARTYFGVFGYHVRADQEAFAMDGRTRRPPRDRVNAVLSFLYALLRAECIAGLESVGLDPQVGFLHALRPGRPALALDLMEEFRPIVADRLALTLINRKQLQAEHFVNLPGGAVHLNDDGRKAVLQAYQQRKEDEVHHRMLDQKLPIGLVPYVQARLLARHLRGDLEEYPPYLSR